MSGSGSLLFTLPGCLSGAGWGHSTLSITFPFFPGSQAGDFRVSHLCCLLEGSSALNLHLGPTKPRARLEEAVGVGQQHSSATHLQQPDHSFVNFWIAGAGRELGAHRICLQSHCKENLLQLRNQHLLGAYTLPVTGSSSL